LYRVEQDPHSGGGCRRHGRLVERGHVAGAGLVADVAPGSDASLPHDMTELGGWIYFFAQTDKDAGIIDEKEAQRRRGQDGAGAPACPGNQLLAVGGTEGSDVIKLVPGGAGRIKVFVNGNLRRRITMGALQRKITPRARLAPGRYRLRVRVTFQRGTGSPPVNLTRVIRICRTVAARPRFTG